MELLDIVNDNDEVIGQRAREAIYDKFPTHRIVHVLVFDEAGRLGLQLRNKKLAFAPGHWSTTAGGHVHTGETYDEAAQRELFEELGLKIPFKHFSKKLYLDPRGNKKFLSIYKVTYSGKFNVSKDEVEKLEFFTVDRIKEMIAAGEKFHPELKFIVDNLL